MMACFTTGEEIISSTSWVHYNGFPEEFTDRFKQILDVLSHTFSGNRFPGFFDQDHLADAFQFPHFGNKHFHDNDRNDREKYRVILDIIQLKNNKYYPTQKQ